MISRPRRNAALVLGVLGTVSVLFFASGGIAPCFGGLSGQGAQCVADHWGLATEGAFVPLLAAVWSVAALVWLQPRLTPRLAAVAVLGAGGGVAAWLVTRPWTFSQSTITGSIVTVSLRPTAEVAFFWLIGGALAAVAVTALVVHLRGDRPEGVPG